jgi:hypothetical protein
MKRLVSSTDRKHRLLLAGDIVGWIGAASLISAYVLVSIGCVNGDSFEYQALNILGAIGLLILGIARRAIPSVVTNIVWAIVGIVAIIGILL